MVVCKKAYHKKYYAKNREQILARQKRYRAENAEILKWYENNRYEVKQQGKARQQPESLLSTKQRTHQKLPKTIL